MYPVYFSLENWESAEIDIFRISNNRYTIISSCAGAGTRGRNARRRGREKG